MRKQPLVLKITAALLVAGGLVWLIRYFFEPAYHGKSLSVWLEEACQNGDMDALFAGDAQPDTSTANAVRAIGADGIPALIALVHAKETPFTKRVRRLREGAANRWIWLPINLGEPDGARVERLREEAAYAFRVLGPTGKSAVPHLVGLLNDEDEHVRGHAAYCLGAIGPPSAIAVPDLERYLDAVLKNQLSAWGEEAYYALHALGDIGPAARSALPKITGLTNNSSPSRRSGWAKAALIKITGSGLDSAIEPLKNPSDYTNWQTAFVVVRELGSKATPAVTLLLADLQQTDQAVQMYAIEALGRVHAHPEQCIPAVIPFLRSPNTGIRASSLRTISAFGRSARQWAPTAEIVGCFADSDPSLRKTATNTLRRISLP